MNIRHAQLTLVAVFLVSFLMHLIAFICTYFNGAIYLDNLKDLFVEIIVIYSVPLGIIIGGIFAKGRKAKNRIPKLAFWIALSLGVIWNAMLLWRSIVFITAGQDSIEIFIDYLHTVASSGSFLIAGALTYFFCK